MLPLLLLTACEREAPEPGDPWLPPNEVPWLDDGPVDDLVNARRFSLLLPEAAPVEITCEHDTDPTEVHVVTSQAGDRLQEIDVYGLLADADYTCTITSGDWSETRAFHTDVPPAYVPRWDVEQHADWWGAYVLLNHGYIGGNRRTCLLIVDRDGRLRWYKRIVENPPDLDAQYLGGGEILFGGGHEVVPTVVDLRGLPRLIGMPAFTGETYHHHTERLESRQVLTLVHDQNVVGDREWDGFGVTLLSPTLTSNDWVLRSQDLVDAGVLEVPPGSNNDPWHANAAIARDGIVYVNLRQAHQLLAFDQQSKDLLWTFGWGGDFTLLDEDGSEAPAAEFAWGAHAPELDGDRLLVYDNGYQRPGGSYSRVVEFELDVPARTARVVWDYGETGWFEQIWGDVDRLPDGQVLFVRAHCDGCGGAPNGRTQIVVVDPETNEVSWRLKMSESTSAGYRAQAIDGCDLFANQKYCF